MKKLAVTTIGLCLIALTILAFEPFENITISLTTDEANTYSQSMVKVEQLINDSDMKASERKEAKALLNSATSLLISKIVKQIDTVKKKK